MKKWWYGILAFLGLGAIVGTASAGKTPEVMPMILILEQARNYVGTRESGGKNRGELVDQWNKANKSDLGSNWCANFLAAMVRAALGTKVPSWLRLSPTAREWMTDFKKKGQWIPKSEALKYPALVKPGMIPVWDRSAPGRPETVWWGHIGVVERGVEDGSFTSIEGNSGPAGEEVAAMKRKLDDDKLYGFGWV